MKVAQGLAGDFAIAFRFELTTTARRPVVAEHGPSPALVCLEVHLEYLASSCASHHHMLEALLWGRSKQFGSEDERNVDATLIDSVEVNERVTAPRKRLDSSHEHLQHRRVLHLADAEQIGSQPAPELSNDRGELLDLAIPKLRSPVGEVTPDRPLELLRPGSIAMIEQVFEIPPC